MSQIDQLIDDAQDIAERIDGLIAELKLLRKSLRKSDDREASPVYLRPDGRLTDQGVRYCHAAFGAGRGPSDIARVLGVTVPAVIARRRSWEARKGEKKAKSKRRAGA